MLTLRNPHSVLAAIAARPRDVRRVRLPSGEARGAWAEVVEAAERAGIDVETGRPSVAITGRRRRREREERGGRGPGAEALVRECDPVSLDRLFAEPGARGVWIALDGVQDPQNVGSIVRSAAFFGVRGLLVMSDRAAPLSSVVYDVASGGMEAMPHAQETNLRRALEAAKAAGVWVLGSSEHAERDAYDVPRDRPWLLVLGNEERGLRRLTLETCDEVCTIPRPSPGSVTEVVRSLNVGVAAGILLAALTREGPG